MKRRPLTQRQFLDKSYNLAASELLSDDDLLVAVYAVNLEYVLGDIQTKHRNLHVARLSHVIRRNDHPMAIRCRERTPPPHQSRPKCAAANQRPIQSPRRRAREAMAEL